MECHDVGRVKIQSPYDLDNLEPGVLLLLLRVGDSGEVLVDYGLKGISFRRRFNFDTLLQTDHRLSPLHLVLIKLLLGHLQPKSRLLLPVPLLKHLLDLLDHVHPHVLMHVGRC